MTVISTVSRFRPDECLPLWSSPQTVRPAQQNCFTRKWSDRDSLGCHFGATGTRQK